MERCLNASVVAVKTIRFPIEFLPQMSNGVDLVLLLVRDPRGTLHSRQKSAVVTLKPAQAAEPLCKRLEADYKYSKMYNLSVPIRVVRYEDYASAPVETAAAVYGFCGVDASKEVLDALYNLSHAEKDDGRYLTHQQNSTATAYAWAEILSDEVVQVVNKYCRKALRLFHYEEIIRSQTK
jgi:hypothetical protein